MEFLSLSHRRSSSRNIPQMMSEGNVCHSQAKNRTAGAKETVLIALNWYDGLLPEIIRNHLLLTMTVFYYVKLLGSHQYLTVSSIVHSWLEKRWHLLMQGNRYNILYLCYSSTWLLGTLRSGNVTATRTTKKIGLVGKTTALHLHHTFLYINYLHFCMTEKVKYR